MVLWCCPSVMVVCQSGGCVNRAKTMSQATQATLDALLERWGCFGVPQGTWECQNPQCQHSWCGEMEENFPSLFETEVNSLHKEGCGYSTTTMPKFNSSNHLNLYSSYHIEVQPDYIQQFFSSFFLWIWLHQCVEIPQFTEFNKIQASTAQWCILRLIA